jgi:glycosyltransferase involved in cell wall biosynthesis
LFAGFVRGAELDAVYKVADIYVLPSVSEPFGITPLESLVNGTPVLVSKQSGVAEVLSHALKADFWDIDEMANQIIAVLCYPTLRQTLAEYGKGEAHNITWTKAATKCLNLYKSFI